MIIFWYNSTAVCGLSAWWLYGGANDNLLQDGLCHMLFIPDLLQPEPLFPWQATQTYKVKSGSVSVGSLSPGAQKVLFEPSEHIWGVQCLILNAILPLLPSYWDFFFALVCGVSFFFF